MKKITLFVGMIAMAAFFTTTVIAQNQAQTVKPATTQTTQPKADAKTPAACAKKDAAKDGCKPGCTMHKDKCCDKGAKAATPATATPDKK